MVRPRLDVPVDLAISERLPAVPLSAPFRDVCSGRGIRDCSVPRVADAFDVGSMPVEVPFRTEHLLGAVVNWPSVWPDR
jgi:hypothetical protein